MRPLEGMSVLTLAVNLPGPLAAARCHALGATVTKIEPTGGDQLARVQPEWYEALHQGLTRLTLDLKSPDDRRQLDDHLVKSDLLLTATRPAGLRRLGLDWPTLHGRYPRLCQVAIVGSPSPDQDVPGHDLTYQAQAGLLDPPRLPRSCLADLGGAASHRGCPRAAPGAARPGRAVCRGEPCRDGARLRRGLALWLDAAGWSARRRLSRLQRVRNAARMDCDRSAGSPLLGPFIERIEPDRNRARPLRRGLSHAHGRRVGDVGRRARPAPGACARSRRLTENAGRRAGC